MLLRYTLISTLLLAACGLALGQDDPPNLVENPSLEGPLADTGLPEGWRGWWFRGAEFKASVGPGARTGEKALLLEGGGKFGGVTTTKVPVHAGKRYRARGWVRFEGDPEAVARITLDFMRANGDYLQGVSMGEVPAGEAGWQCITNVGHAADVPEAETVGIVLSLKGKGKAWYDDIQLIEEEMPKPGESLMANGTMEEVAGGRPAYWFVSTAPGAKVILAASEQEPKEGKRCLNLKGKAPYAVAVGERYRVDAGKTYTETGFVRVRSGQASVKIDYYHGDQYLGCTEAAPANTNAWNERSVTTDFAKYPNATHFAVSLVAFGGDLDADFDDVRLTAK